LRTSPVRTCSIEDFAIMWLLWVGVTLLVLKLLDFWIFGELSWWWVALPFVAAFVWFEAFERRMGWDKKQAFDEIDQAKAKRIREQLDRDKDVSRHRR
jgi:small Trp-rich protein